MSYRNGHASMSVAIIDQGFSPKSLPSNPKRKSALLINPPVYDTQYWAEWSQPYGLLRIAALLRSYRYKQIEFFDFMEARAAHGDPNDPEIKRVVPKHRIHCDESYAEQAGPVSKARPYIIEKNGENLRLFKFHFGKTWLEFEDWIQAKGFTPKHPPHEIYIASVMSYWWESTRDLVARLRQLFGWKSKIIVGGIYPSIASEHAARYTGADIIAAGEVHEANDLWTNLDFYETRPSYAIITPSRGCPFDCHYCAARTLNGGIAGVRFRSVADIFSEMEDKHERYGIRDFAFYADFLLIRYKENLLPLLKKIIETKKPWRLYAPEGLDTRFLAESQELCDLLKSSNFQKIYLPVENVDDNILVKLNRKHVKLRHVTKAVENLGRAGFRLRYPDVNGYCLYGLPGEKIHNVVETVLFISDTIGSVIPMLFAPVPSTNLFERYRDYYRQRGWCEPDGSIRDLHLINGKLFPFLTMNEGSIEDYIELQRLMFMLNQTYRSKSFNVFGTTTVARVLREVVSEFKLEEENTVEIPPTHYSNGSALIPVTQQTQALPIVKSSLRIPRRPI